MWSRFIPVLVSHHGRRSVLSSKLKTKDTNPINISDMNLIGPSYRVNQLGSASISSSHILALPVSRARYPVREFQVLHEQELLRSVRRRIFSSLQSCLFQTELPRIEHVVFNPKNCSFGALSASLRQTTKFQVLLVQRAVLIQAMEPELIAF